MRPRILLLALGCLVAAPALTQIRNVPLTSMNPQLVLPAEAGVQDKVENQAKIDSTNAAQIPAERKFAIIEYKDNDAFLDSFYVKKLITEVIMIEEGMITKRDTQSDTATLYLPSDDQVYVGTTEWHANAKYDTTWTETARIDDAATEGTRWTITNMFKAANSTKPELLYKKSFTAVQTVSSASSASITVTCDRAEFYSENFSGHGYVKIFVDGQQVATTFQGGTPLGTDFARMVPRWYYIFPKAEYNSPAKPHVIRFETDPGNQYIIDMVRTLNMTLTPRVKLKTAAKK